MGQRQKDWARHTRLKLRRLLGMACKVCNSKYYMKLEFDCIIPQGDTHHRYEWSHRMSFYNQQYRNGNLQLLCQKCHNKKTLKDNERLETTPY